MERQPESSGHDRGHSIQKGNSEKRLNARYSVLTRLAGLRGLRKILINVETERWPRLCEKKQIVGDICLE